MTSIAYLGPSGTYSGQAAAYVGELLPGTQCTLKALPSIFDALWEAHQGAVDLSVVPIENSIEGTINITQDVLTHEVDLKIAAELVLDINHYLISKETEYDKVHSILSHPQAIAQCRKSLKRLFPEAQLIPAASSVDAVIRVAAEDGGLAALASREAAREYDLPVLKASINDYPNNKTRFLVVAKNRIAGFTGCYKTSLVLALDENKPGGLYSILKHFADASIDLTRIESRPAKKELGDYLFYIDCDGSLENQSLKTVWNKLKQEAVFLKLLGSYPQLTVPGTLS